MELKLSQSSPPVAIFNRSSFFPRHITLLSQKWKLDIQRISWKGQYMTKKILVHVVKEGETLSSISKMYGVSILEIAAANKEIADVDLVFHGQHLNIPSAIVGYAQVCHFEGNKDEHKRSNASPDLRFRNIQWNQIFTMSSFHQIPLAKPTGYFLLLVPLIALCIRCIMGALEKIVVRNLRHQAEKKSNLHHHSSDGVRWKTALSDLRDPESLDVEAEPDSDQPLTEDQQEFLFEDVSHGYTKLEGDYQKFLSECGMSNWGYWRGGSPQ